MLVDSGNKTTPSSELLGNVAYHRKSFAVGVVWRGNCSTTTTNTAKLKMDVIYACIGFV